MDSVSGVALPVPPEAFEPKPPKGPEEGEDLFAHLVVSAPPPRRGGRLTFGVSMVAHVAVLLALVLVPLFMPPPPPERTDYIRLLLYDPPPPPPPPLPKGAPNVREKPVPSQKVVPEPVRETPRPDALVMPEVAEVRPEAGALEGMQAGSPTGSDSGVPGGMEEGVEGGVLGGVPGGVIGGVVGGTGTGPVFDYDQPPRLIKQTKPQYPQEAFIKKVEGVVELEITIDVTGRVVHARVVRSIPLLDRAAIQTVLQWVFSPAIKHGRPVPTVASAPVTFKIY